MKRLSPKQLGSVLREQVKDSLEKERPRLATVVHITTWTTTGQVKCAFSNGDIIWVDCSGVLQDLNVDDKIWVKQLGVGMRSQWVFDNFYEAAAGASHVPTVRLDAVTKIHELWASDGDPQAVDVDASGNVTVNPASGDQDFIVESNGEDQILVVDAGTDTVLIGDRDTNYTQFAVDGELTQAGTAQTTRAVALPIATGGGTADIAAFNGAPSINLDADTETFFASFEAPKAWNAASNLTLVLMVANEIAETDGDDVSITCQVRGYADGETTGDAGQTVACAQDLTGGDEAINVVNKVTGAIVYDDGTYPIAAGDIVVIRATVNLAGAGECTGPLHVIGWWVEYTANKLGTAT